MRRSASILLHLTATTLSLALFICSATLWHRSVSLADYYYRLEPVPTGGCALKGFGSYRGAFVIGEILDPTAPQTTGVSPYHHDIYPVLNGPKMMQPVPDTKVSALGFGVSRGELKFNLGALSFLMPKRLYRAVYVPYYFVMLLALIQPIRHIRGILKTARPAKDDKPDLS